VNNPRLATTLIILMMIGTADTTSPGASVGVVCRVSSQRCHASPCEYLYTKTLFMVFLSWSSSRAKDRSSCPLQERWNEDQPKGNAITIYRTKVDLRAKS
jgi:hypothetical protein